MSKTLDSIRKLSHVLAVDDERANGNSIIVTLKVPYCFKSEGECGVRGFDTVAEVERECGPAGVYMRWPDVPGWYWAYGRIAGMREPALMSARVLLEGDKLIVYAGEAMTHRLSFPDPELPLQFKSALLPEF